MFKESKVQEVRKLMNLGKRWEEAGKLERWQLGWTGLDWKGTKKESRTTEKRGS